MKQPEPMKPALWQELDEFIDVEGLRSLGPAITERLRTLEERFPDWPRRFSIESNRDHAATTRPKTLYLTRSRRNGSFKKWLRDYESWKPTRAAPHFEDLMAFIRTLPFERTSRIFLIFDDQALSTPAHVDHPPSRRRPEFIWLRPTLHKRFFLQAGPSAERSYLEGHSVWFDSGRVFHGVEGREGFALSIRIDGEFTHPFRRQLGWAK